MPIDFGLPPITNNISTNTPAPTSDGSTTDSTTPYSGTSGTRQPMDFGLPPASSNTTSKSDTKPTNAAANTGDVLADIEEGIRSRANATAIGIEHGVNMFSSTLEKAVTKYTAKPVQTILDATGLSKLGINANTPEAAQQYYNDRTKDYNTNPDSVAHPMYSGVGNVAGGMAMTAPAMALAPEAVGALGASTAADLGANGFIQGAAKLAGYGLANAVQGGVTGGLANTDNNTPNSLWNAQGAKTGAEVGGVLGTMGGAIGEGAKNAAQYETAVNSLKDSTGYTGKVLGTDVVQQDAKEWITNNVLAKIPFITDLKTFGVNGARQEQQGQLAQTLQQSVGNFIQNLASKYPEGNIAAYGKAVGNAWSRAQQTIGQLGQAFKTQAKQAGADTINVLDDQGNNSIKSFLQDNNKVLSDDTKNFIKSKLDNNNWSLNDLIGGQDKNGNYQAGLKQILFKESDRLGGDPTKTANYNASNAAQNLYNQVNGMISNAVKGSEAATATWNSFNTTTHNLMDMFSKQNSPNLAKAVNDYNGSMNGVQTLFNKMVGNTLPSPVTNRYNSLIGKEGSDIVQNQQNVQALQSVLKSSQKPDGTIDLTGMMNQIDKQGANIPKEFSDQMQGLFNLVSKNQAGLRAAGNTQPGFVSGGIGAAAGWHNPIATAAVTVGATALSGLISNTALGRTLMFLNKAATPGTSQYLMNQASKYITSAGLVMTHDDQGNTNISKPQN